MNIYLLFLNLLQLILQGIFFFFDLPQEAIPGALERSKHCASGICAGQSSWLPSFGWDARQVFFVEKKKTASGFKKHLYDGLITNSLFCDLIMIIIQWWRTKYYRKSMRFLNARIFTWLVRSRLWRLFITLVKVCSGVWCKTWGEGNSAQADDLSSFRIISLFNLSLTHLGQKIESVIWHNVLVKNLGKNGHRQYDDFLTKMWNVLLKEIIVVVRKKVFD